MRVITGYFVYRAYISFKRHFKNELNLADYKFRVIGKKGLPETTYLQRRDIHFFEKLAERLVYKDKVYSFFVPGFLYNPDAWIGDFVNEYSFYENKMYEWEGTIKDMPYNFKRDVIFLLDHELDFKSKQKTVDIICDAFYGSNIKVETLIILKKLLNLSLESNISYAYLYDKKYIAYEKLLLIDIIKYKDMLKKLVVEHFSVDNT